MFWFDKNNPLVLFCDNRKESTSLCDGRHFEVNPDVVCDFTSLPFPDESFWHVVFDPPHLLHGGDSSWIVKKYGRLPKDWGKYVKAGFDECMRVLKVNGTLVFKWSEVDVSVGQIIKAVERNPLYGQKERKSSNTHWLCFIKEEQR